MDKNGTKRDGCSAVAVVESGWLLVEVRLCVLTETLAYLLS